MSKLLIIDGNALIHRAYHALPDFMSNGGTPTNAVYGFASVLHKVRTQLQPTHLLVCFDTQAPTFRDEMFKEYRAHRPKTDDDLIKQFPLVRNFLDAAGVKHIEKDGVEADDLIAVAAKEAKKNGLNTIILTGDKDIFQLIEKSILVLTPQIGYVKHGILYDRDGVIKKFGVPPEQIADFKALVGDPSDNYKGVKGIGPKAAVALIKAHGSVEHVYEKINEISNPRIQKLLEVGKEDALMAKKLAVLLDEVEGVTIKLAELKFNAYKDSLKDFFEKYSFRTLKQRFFNEKTKSSKKTTTAEKKKKVESKDQLGLF